MPDAVVLPGRTFGSGAPLPMYASDVAARRGATVHRHEWVGSPPGEPVSDPPLERWVADQVTPLLDRLGGRPLLIGKSLGTSAAGVAADRRLPAVWLTPLLTMPRVAAGLRRATAPFLLVGGTADRVWDGAAARRLTPYVHEVAGGDHGLYVPGPLTASIAVLAGVVEAVDAFLDAVDFGTAAG